MFPCISMYVSMYLYVCLCMFLCISMHLYMYVYVCFYTFLCMYMYVSMHFYVCLCMFLCSSMYVYVCSYAFLCMFMYVSMQFYVCMCMFLCISMYVFSHMGHVPCQGSQNAPLERQGTHLASMGGPTQETVHCKHIERFITANVGHPFSQLVFL